MELNQEKLNKFSFDYWYPLLKNHTVRSNFMMMNDDFREFLLNGEFIIDNDQFPELKSQIENYIISLDGIVFAKLNFSAPLDSTFVGFNRTLEIKSFEDMIYLFKASTRILIDLTNPFGSDLLPPKPIIVLKKWFNYKPEREFRILVKNSELFYITSRNYQIPCPIEEDTVFEKSKSIVDEVLNMLHCDNIVIDIYISPKLRPHIIDLAPFSPIIEPGLFSWEEILSGTDNDIRLCSEFMMQSNPDPSIPVEMLDGSNLNSILESYKEFMKEHGDD